MQAEKMTSSTSASESFSRSSLIIIKIWVAALFSAVTLLMFPIVSSAYSVNVDGVPQWQSELADRSLTAVAAKLPSNNAETAAKIIKTVSEKLFTGYRAEVRSFEPDIINVLLISTESSTKWVIELTEPNIQSPALEWFRKDSNALYGAILPLIENMPLEALNWCDTGLRDEILKIMKEKLSGWRASFVVIAEKDRALFKVSFTPDLPFVLAVNPKFTSNTLPTLIHEDLKEDLMERFTPFVGIPVEWAKFHSEDITKWSELVLEDRNIVQKTNSVPKASFSAASVSHLNVNVESKSYNVGAWAAVYAGTSDKTAEVGFHLGKIVQLMPRWDMEFYGEGIIELQNWNTEGRLGLRWSPWGDVWLGGEWSSKDEMWWGRLNIDQRLHKPYFWLRVREDGEINTALGWKATSYISFELHYDSRDEDTVSLRMLGNL